MGKWLNEINGIKLPEIGKVDAIKKILPLDSVTVIDQPEEWREDIVCVVENHAFDAAGYIYDQKELERAIGHNDLRKKTWLIVPNAKNYVN